MGQILSLLENLGLTSSETKHIFANRTRDREDVKVWQDAISKVIFIDDFYVGENEYISGDWRKSIGQPDLEEFSDYTRRKNSFEQFYVGKKICDFGCGRGDFLRNISDLAVVANGVELQADYVSFLNENGIETKNKIESFDHKFDSIFMFHTLEHFQDPIDILSSCINKLEIDGRMIIEVPHANDALMQLFGSQEFIEFTLWSQHLILHTRESLNRLLTKAGFNNIVITGVQRYSLSNHLNWLGNGTPGGHKSHLSVLDTQEILAGYEAALNKIDSTDTLIAIAEIQ
jgi:2-polyprenyl-3-methyl-5-hydroxy-6-metoxy-1,4-benzoquinol methylase